MLLCADMGNSHISLGIYDNDNLIMSSYLKTDTDKTSDQYSVELFNILNINGIEPKKIDKSVLGSVVPSLTAGICGAIEKITSSKCLIIGPGIKTGLNIKIDNPAQLGADLACGAAAAMEKYPLPCIIADLGTATKIHVVTKDGSYIGGMIAPGVGISNDALSSRAAQLPQFGIEAPKRAICSSTVECMRSGAVLGTAAMIDGMIDRFEDELGEKAFAVATGGFSHIIIPHCRREIKLDESLILDGLRIIYNKNR